VDLDGEPWNTPPTMGAYVQITDTNAANGLRFYRVLAQ
jgi:hypothetical protein